MNPRYEGMERTLDVLNDVFDERLRQIAQYGHNDDLEDGTGPEVAWLTPLTHPIHPQARHIEEMFRMTYEEHEREFGKPTWMHLVREEIAEAFQEDDPVRLAEELVQVAALCVSWVETLQKRLG